MPHKDPEARRAYIKARYWANREALLAKNKAWREANLEHIHAYQKDWRNDHKDYLREYWRHYRATHGEQIRAYERLRYATLPRVRAVKQAYRDSHVEELRALARTWRQTHAEHCRQRNRARYAADAAYRARVLAASRHWYALYPAVAKSSNEAWRLAHPEAFKVYGERYRARKRQAAINDFTPAQWIEMQAMYDHRCQYCQHRRKGKLTQDHIIPLFNGGNHTWTNIIPACQSCNSKKGTKTTTQPLQTLLKL